VLDKKFFFKFALILFLAVFGCVSRVYAAPPGGKTLSAEEQIAGQAQSNVSKSKISPAEKETIVAQIGTIKMASGEKVVLTFTPEQNLSSITTSPAIVKSLIQNGFASIDQSNITLSSEGLNILVSGVIKQGGPLNGDADQNHIASVGGHLVIQSDQDEALAAIIIRKNDVAQIPQPHRPTLVGRK